MPARLADRMAPIIAKYARTNTVHYDRVTAFIDRIGQVARRLGPGDTAPDFILPSHDGSLVRLSDLNQDAPLVLFFIRGIWCPFCVEQMHAMKDAAHEFREAGLNVAVVTPEIGGRASALASELGAPFPVLCDIDSGTALAYGCLFPMPPEDQAFLKSRKIDLAQNYGTNAWFVPLPSVFGIGTDGVIASAYGGADPRIRPEPEDILHGVRQAISGLKD